MSERNPAEESRTELYEREMKHDEHRETPLDTAGREADEEERAAARRRRERESSEQGGEEEK